MNVSRLLALASLIALPTLASAQITWTNSGADYLFSNSTNWTGGVPASGAALSLASSDFVGLDNGGDFAAGSLTIESGIYGSFIPAGPETFSIGSGGINNLGLGVEFHAPLLVLGSQTWNVGSGTFLLNNVLGFAPGAVLTINIGTGALFDFAMAVENPAWFGEINFIGDLSGASLFANGSGFTADNLAHITLDGIAAQLDGNRLVAGGAATAVPEPSTYALTAGVALLALAITRRLRARPAQQSSAAATT